MNERMICTSVVLFNETQQGLTMRIRSCPRTLWKPSTCLISSKSLARTYKTLLYLGSSTITTRCAVLVCFGSEAEVSSRHYLTRTIPRSWLVMQKLSGLSFVSRLLDAYALYTHSKNKRKQGQRRRRSFSKVMPSNMLNELLSTAGQFSYVGAVWD